MLGVIARERERKKLCCAPHAALSLSLSLCRRQSKTISCQSTKRDEERVESGGPYPNLLSMMWRVSEGWNEHGCNNASCAEKKGKE